MTSISTQESKKSIFHRYPLGSFFALAYLFLLIAILIIGAVVSLTTVTDFSMDLLIAAAAWTPNLAAVVVTRVTDGKSAVKGLFAGWMQWRVNPG